MKNLVTYILESLNNNFNDAMFISYTDVLFKLLCGLGFGNENDDYINVYIEDYNIECPIISENNIKSIKKIMNIIDASLSDTNYYAIDNKRKKDNVTIHNIEIYNKNNKKLIFTITVKHYGIDAWMRTTYGRSSSSIDKMIQFSGDVWKVYKTGSYKIDSKYDKDIFAGGYWREIHKTIKKDVVVIPNIKKFNTAEEYKALIDKSAKEHEHSEYYDKTMDELCNKIVNTVDSKELDKVIQQYLK